MLGGSYFGRSYLGSAAFEPILAFERRIDVPSLLLQTVIVPGAKTWEGQLVEAVALPWFEIIDLLNRDENLAYEIDARSAIDSDRRIGRPVASAGGLSVIPGRKISVVGELR